MARFRINLRNRFPLVLMLIALVAATSFFLGVMWQAYNDSNPIPSDSAATNDFHESVVLSQANARISTVQQSDRTLICAEVGSGKTCSAADTTKPLTMLSGSSAETYIAVVDPQHRIAHVKLSFGNQHVELTSQDDGLSVSAALAKEPDSFEAVGRDGQILTRFP